MPHPSYNLVPGTGTSAVLPRFICFYVGPFLSFVIGISSPGFVSKVAVCMINCIFVSPTAFDHGCVTDQVF